MTERRYPDELVGDFPEPPIYFADAEGREIEIRAYAGERVARERSEPRVTTGEFGALVEMYAAFDPSDRAQGLPPAGERAIENWLDTILGDDCFNVIAWDGELAVGHATLVPDTDDYELAIFVLQEYQNAGIGTRLVEALLGHGRAAGVERVWLTVERWNQAAVSLYRKMGFETSNAESFELEMTLRLDGEG